MKISKLVRLGKRYSLVVLIMLVWQFLPQINSDVARVLPPLSEVLYSGFDLIFLSGALLDDIKISLYRIALGFGLATLVAIPLGIIMGEYEVFKTVLDPIIEMFRPLSPIALFPLFILIFGIGLTSKVAIIFWICLFPIILNTYKGVTSVEPILVDAARSMGASKMNVFTSVVMPHSLYWIITGLRLSMGSAFLALIAAEMIGSSKGLGYFVLFSARTFEVTEMYVGIILIGLLGYFFNHLFLSFEAKFSKWR